MSRFIESICMKGGSYHLLNYHQDRINRTFAHFFQETQPWRLSDILPEIRDGLNKVRVVYDGESYESTVNTYHVKRPELVKIVHCDDIEYSFKYENRSKLTELLTHDKMDVIIIKEGFVTDASYANLIFWDGTDWITPRSYLLNGVKRQYLLDLGLIREGDISIEEIVSYEKVCLVNAMLDPGEVSIPVDRVQ